MINVMFAQDAAVDPIVVTSSGSPIGGLVPLAIYVLMIVAMWKVFTKAGEPGWAAIVPIYNVITMLKIAGKPAWMFLLGPIGYIVAAIGIAKRFDRGGGFAAGLILLPFVFWPMLAFGSASAAPDLRPQAA
jgi:hypothetical protein